MRSDELDFELPAELIAQTPSANRSESRLLHYARGDRSVRHRTFSDLAGVLRAGDLLVFNDAKVMAARLALRKVTGGRVEGLFLAQSRPGVWRVMLKNIGPFRPGLKLHFVDEPQLTARVIAKEGDQYWIELSSDEPAGAILERIGRMPLPPYIRREKEHDPRDDEDRRRYQTIYAAQGGSIAAPTAGLHFTRELMNRLDEAGIERVFVTLHVGLGTFKPVTAEHLAGHMMHVESYELPQRTAEALNQAKRAGRRIIAVGTTSARVLEGQEDDQFTPKTGETGIFIHPPYHWRHVGGLITNFHLPRSTLIALVAAMVGLDEQRRIYRQAIEQRYRFFSYGDAMLIE
ncbi:MAG: tRNA preQ1(34) S-adenosylmethionine ribosyltransferase-isomerase QueA [Phycisphaerales bacterium]|nr:tRNA preQ1(34) S-adenosylmethionine ribosyltransferase-isomerase QueA [Phycisphaerales bacterium]